MKLFPIIQKQNYTNKDLFNKSNKNENEEIKKEQRSLPAVIISSLASTFGVYYYLNNKLTNLVKKTNASEEDYKNEIKNLIKVNENLKTEIENLEKNYNKNYLDKANQLEECNYNLNSVLSNNIFEDIAVINLFSEKYGIQSLKLENLSNLDLKLREQIILDLKNFIIFKIFRIIYGFKYNFENEKDIIQKFNDKAFVRFCLKILIILEQKKIIERK